MNKTFKHFSVAKIGDFPNVGVLVCSVKGMAIQSINPTFEFNPSEAFKFTYYLRTLQLQSPFRLQLHYIYPDVNNKNATRVSGYIHLGI